MIHFYMQMKRIFRLFVSVYFVCEHVWILHSRVSVLFCVSVLTVGVLCVLQDMFALSCEVYMLLSSS